MNNKNLMTQLAAQSIPFDQMEHLDDLVKAIGDADTVLLGEASHGTSEFYTIRAELSRRLIEEKGFHVIAVEGDWPSVYEINRYIKGYDGSANSPEEAIHAFHRWPQWMWANREVTEFVRWLKGHNAPLSERNKVGFYGIDMYSLWDSMEEIIQYLEQSGTPEQLELARNAFACFEPYGGDEQTYGISAGLLGEGCEDEVIALLSEMNRKRHQKPESEAALNAEVNSLVVASAENYYRTMVRGGPESWNVRDRHMVKALNKVRDFYGKGVKVIVWAHNTHIGDARATDMLADGMVNIGQLLREQEGLHVYSVGFGTYQGEVLAGSAWGSPVQVMQVPAGKKGSWEHTMHEAFDGKNRIVLMDGLQKELSMPIGHRAIGVVYDPGREYGNYVPSFMAERYDAFIHVDQSHALQAIPAKPIHNI